MRLNSKLLFSFLSLALIGATLAGCSRAGIVRQRPGQVKAGTATAVSIAPPLQEVPVGEQLEYDIFWWGIRVGNAKMTTSLHQNKKQKLIDLNFQADSNWYLTALYPVHVRLNSLVNPKTLTPVRFESYLKRQWRVHESLITFDLSQKSSVHELPGDKVVFVPVGPATQDGLSMIYYARTMPLQLGKTFPMEISADGKNWTLNGTVVQAGIVRIGNAGYWPALEGEVELAYPVPFFYGATARVWFSADQDRIPLLAKIRSRIGPVTVVLTRRTVVEEKKAQ